MYMSSTINWIKRNIIVAVVKSRPVLHYCVVIYFWSSGIVDCMLSTLQNIVPLMRYGTSVVWRLSLLLINSFNKNDAAYFPKHLCFRGGGLAFLFFADYLYVKLNCVISQYTAKSTYCFIFHVTFKMNLMCTYASVANMFFPDPSMKSP